MKFNKFYLLASASGLALTGSAHAADLGPAPLPAYPVAAPLTWAGWYAGINGGVVTAQSTTQDLNNWADPGYVSNTTTKQTGGTLGGQIGYNWQDDAFVYGFEGDFNWVWAKATNNLSLCTGVFCAANGGTGSSVAVVQSEMNWLSTIRGRAGIAVGSTQGTLLYVTGGVAIAGIKNNWGAGYTGGAAAAVLNPNSFSSNSAKVGWTAGVGVEHMFAGMPHWSFKAEALWVQLENTTVTNPGPSPLNVTGGPFHTQFQNEAVIGRLGLNYKF
jgi:outer membrane immunogenic protein